MYHSRISVLDGHNKDRKTDELYEPLRKTFLLDTTAKKTYLEDVSRVSHLSHLTKIHNYSENHDLGERTLIPEDERLIRVNSISRLPKDHQYYIINAQERQLPSISQEELDQRLRNQKEQVYMYVYADENISRNPEPKLNSKPPPADEPNVKSGIKVMQNKYNFFSCIDEGVNNLISGQSCTCPANELVASRRTEVYWDIDDVQEHQSKP